MTRWFARAPIGKRAYGHAPLNYGDNITLVMGLRLSGIVSPILLKGSMTNEAFAGYIQQRLAPSIRAGDVVIMDRLSAHRQTAVAEAIEAVGAEVLLLPPYSPDLSPVEACGSKVKTLLRGTAARTYSLLVKAAADALDRVSAADAKGWFGHYGYL